MVWRICICHTKSTYPWNIETPFKPNRFHVTIAFVACGRLSVDPLDGLLAADVDASEEVEHLSPGEMHTLTGELPSTPDVDRNNSWGWEIELHESLPPYSTEKNIGRIEYKQKPKLCYGDEIRS